MKIGLLDIDGHSNFPNFALCKISAYWKSKGAEVEWYTPFNRYDICYCSKVFTFTPDYLYPINAKEVIKGGTGYSIEKKLPIEMENIQPDLSIYPNFKHAIGFLTRGCIRSCSWCIVQKKEGNIKPYAHIEDVLQGRKSAILMDNNILANYDFAISEFQKIINLGIKVDFNQGLDARLVTDETAKLLAKIKWIRYPRFSCDTKENTKHIKQAIKLLRKYGYKGEVFIYVLLTEDIHECLDRIMDLDFLDWTKSGERINKIKLFAQPYIDYLGKKTFRNVNLIWRDGAIISPYFIQRVLKIIDQEKDFIVENILNKN